MKMSSEIHVESESHVRIEQNRIADGQISSWEEARNDIRAEQVNSVESVTQCSGSWKIMGEEGA